MNSRGWGSSPNGAGEPELWNSNSGGRRIGSNLSETVQVRGTTGASKYEREVLACELGRFRGRQDY